MYVKGFLSSVNDLKLAKVHCTTLRVEHLWLLDHVGTAILQLS